MSTDLQGMLHYLSAQDTDENVNDAVTQSLRVYLDSFSSNLQGLLRKGTSVSTIAAPVDPQGALVLMKFGPETSGCNVTFHDSRTLLNDAVLTFGSVLHGKDLPTRLGKFVADVSERNGKVPAVLIADDGALFYRPDIGDPASARNVSELDARSIAKAVA
jgi:hypothetical protein